MWKRTEITKIDAHWQCVFEYIWPKSTLFRLMHTSHNVWRGQLFLHNIKLMMIFYKASRHPPRGMLSSKLTNTFWSFCGSWVSTLEVKLCKNNNQSLETLIALISTVDEIARLDMVKSWPDDAADVWWKEQSTGKRTVGFTNTFWNPFVDLGSPFWRSNCARIITNHLRHLSF